MTGAECLLRTLLKNGVNICFMNPGTSEMQFVAALDRVSGMRPVLGLFEGVCSGAADGYARMTRKPAATLLHLGPGLGNALANFHNARKARSPVVNIVGDHATAHQKFDAPLSADVPAFARTISDSVRVVGSSAEMGALATQTVEAAMGPPGQIATLIVPADFSWSEAGEEGDWAWPLKRARASDRDIEEAALLLRKLGPEAGVLMGGQTMVDAGLTAAERITKGSGARLFYDRNTSRAALGGGRFAPQRVAYFPEKAEAQFHGLQHVVLIEAKAPVSFFAYPGRKSTLLPDDCAVTVLAGVDGDGLYALEVLADHFPAPEPSGGTDARNARANKRGMATPAKMAIPPPRGVAPVWTFRPPGLSTKPIFSAIRLTINVASHEMMKLIAGRQRRGRIIRSDQDTRHGSADRADDQGSLRLRNSIWSRSSPSIRFSTRRSSAFFTCSIRRRDSRASNSSRSISAMMSASGL